MNLLRTNPIPVRFSDQELEMVDRAANQKGQRRGEFLRNAVLTIAGLILGEQYSNTNLPRPPQAKTDNQ